MSASLWPHGLQHTRFPCSSLSLGVCSNSCPLSQWCHPDILSSVVPFSSCPQSFPASRSFPMGQLFILSGQNIGASALASVLPMNNQGWLSKGSQRRIDCFDLFDVQGTLKSLLQHHSSKASTLWCSAYFMVQLSNPYMTTGKTIVLTIWTFLSKWCPCFLIRCLGLSQLSFQGASIFQFHNCSHNPQWFWSPRK